MYLLSVGFLLAVVLVGVFFVLIIFLTYRSQYDREKASPYECGFRPLGSARVPFSLHFFLIGIYFIIFDIETVLLIGFPFARLNGGVSSCICVFLFLLILIVGYAHEWRQGSLDWV